MQAITQLVIRQSGWLAFYFALFAFACGTDVCMGLWQGSGLHGYVIHQGKTRNGYIVPVWRSFVQAFIFAGLACTMLGLKIWRLVRVERVGMLPRRR